MRRAASLAAALLLLAIGAARAEDYGSKARELVAKLGGPDPAAAKAAEDAVVALGAAAIPELLPLLEEPMRAAAALAVLERLGPAAKTGTSAVAPFLVDPPHFLRVQAERTLGAFGAGADAAVPRLAEIAGGAAGTPGRLESVDAIVRILTDDGRLQPTYPQSPALEAPIAAGCEWLLRHQTPAGDWSPNRSQALCKGAKCEGWGNEQCAVGLSGLAALALLGAPQPWDVRHTQAIDRAIEALAAAQKPDGFVGLGLMERSLYEHGCAGLALAKACRMRGTPELRDVVERAVAYTRLAQLPDGGWGYRKYAGTLTSNTSVTLWMLRLLNEAAAAGVDVPRESFDRALGYLARLTEIEFGTTSYESGGHLREPEFGSGFRSYPPNGPAPLTAGQASVALLDEMRHETKPSYPNDQDDPRWTPRLKASLVQSKGFDVMLQRPPQWDPDYETTDFCYWMFGAEAMRWADRRRSADWRKSLLAALLPNQAKPGASCDTGSWPPVDQWSVTGGRVYSTSMCVLALEATREDLPARPSLPGGRKTAAALTRLASDDDPKMRSAARRAILELGKLYHD